MAELAQVVSRVFVLPRIACRRALIRSNTLEERLRTCRHRHTVHFAGRAGCHSATETQTAARMAKRAGAGGGVGVETGGTGRQAAAVADKEEEAWST